jgi:hypothetical protein
MAFTCLWADPSGAQLTGRLHADAWARSSVAVGLGVKLLLYPWDPPCWRGLLLPRGDQIALTRFDRELRSVPTCVRASCSPPNDFPTKTNLGRQNLLLACAVRRVSPLLSCAEADASSLCAGRHGHNKPPSRPTLASRTPNQSILSPTARPPRSNPPATRFSAASA